jgi:hypothetical protein
MTDDSRRDRAAQPNFCRAAFVVGHLSAVWREPKTRVEVTSSAVCGQHPQRHPMPSGGSKVANRNIHERLTDASAPDVGVHIDSLNLGHITVPVRHGNCAEPDYPFAICRDVHSAVLLSNEGSPHHLSLRDRQVIEQLVAHETAIRDLPRSDVDDSYLLDVVDDGTPNPGASPKSVKTRPQANHAALGKPSR